MHEVCATGRCRGGDVATALHHRAPITATECEVHDGRRIPCADLVDHALALTNVDHRRGRREQLPLVGFGCHHEMPPEEPRRASDEHESSAAWYPTHTDEPRPVPLRLVPAPHDAAVARHPHLAEPLPVGWVRVDMHSHTMWSGDSTTTPEEIARAVTESGIDVLCITDHNAIKGAVDLAKSLPCRVIVGEELRTHAGEIIGLFLERAHPDRCATGRRSAGHPRARRHRLHPAPLRPDAPQPQRISTRRRSSSTDSSMPSR